MHARARLPQDGGAIAEGEDDRVEPRAAERRGESVTIVLECARDGGMMVARRGDLPFFASIAVVAATAIAATAAAEGDRAL